MSRVVEVSTEGVRIAVSRERVRAASERVLRAEKVADALVNITFVTDRRMAALNRRHLGHSGSTDVISFAFAPVEGVTGLVGDIYIAPAVAARNAKAHGERVRDELLRLVVPGTLHVIGHDHPEGESRYASTMWRRQEQLLRRELASA